VLDLRRHGEKDHPHFGDVAEIYNVIDARQSEAQNTVIEALRLLGHGEAADHYTHFSYEMVALTPRCAAELGYKVERRRQARSYIEVSGRKGFGVKADDLLDQLIASAKKEVDSRHPQLSEPERQEIATQIAIGALRYFMLKYTKQSVIAFDFKEALSFEGETGPYAQYAVVRATSIFRKAGVDPETFLEMTLAEFAPADLANFLSGEAPTKSGSCGWRRPKTSLHHRQSALPRPSRRIWRNMCSNSAQLSTLSTIAIPSSASRTRSGSSSCWRRSRWSGAN
jgi:arginyl-tRNA synthetase